MEFILRFGCFFVLFSVLRCEDSVGKGRFVFSAPKRFLAGSDENVCVSFRDKREGPVSLRVSILEEKKDAEIVSTVQQIAQDEDSKCFKISMPRTNVAKGRLRLTIHFKTEEDYKVNYMKQILIQSNPDITFIQTDKPVYNGGQIVRFRVFTLCPDLKPVFEPIDQIHVENPNGIHVAQWVNVSAADGFIERNFTLSDDPLPGVWRVKVKKTGDEMVAQTFSVEDYVLPRFSVVLKTPEYVESPFDLNVTACAEYTFGQPVRGHIVLQISVECSFAYYCRNRGSSMKKRFQLGQDGCVTHRIQLANITNLAQKLTVNATVEEDGTASKASTFSRVEIKQPAESAPRFSIFVRKRHFKPGLPLKGKISARNFQANTPMSLCLVLDEKRKCEGLIVENNETEFSLPPTLVQTSENFASSVELQHANENQTVARLGLVPWYSPSNSYLLVETLSNGILKCGTLRKFKVSYSMASDGTPMRFQYMIKSRGDIITEGTFLVNSGNETNSKNILSSHQEAYNQDGETIVVNYFNFELGIESKMSPMSYLLIFYIRPDGEIVADTLSLNVEKCLGNKVDLKWNEGESEPGVKNVLKIKSSPNSVCAVSVVDQSLKLISESGNVDEDAIFKAIEKFEIKPQFSEHCSDRYKIRANDYGLDALEPLYDATTGISRFVDSLQAFDDFGVAVITDLTLETRPCMENEKVAGELMNNLTSRHSLVKIDDERNFLNSSDWDEKDVPHAPSLFNSKYLTKQPFGENLRSFFPETWIWDVTHLNSSGDHEIEVSMPHTLTTWNADAVCLSPIDGLGISKTSQVRSFKPFFLDFTLPRTVKRKEILHFRVSVFNYLDEALPIKISFLPSDNFVSKSEESVRLCVEPKTKNFHIFPLEATKLGEAKVKVKGEIDFGKLENCDNSFNKSQEVGVPSKNFSDAVLKKTTVTHEGFPVEQVKSGFICGENANFENSISWNLKLPVDIVETSVSISALVSGDILGPAFQNTNNLISLPTGCGEQNMILLVPNLLLLEYFLLTKSKDSKLIETALKNLDIGYQNQLKYKREDGSYSAFGEKDEKGSIWLTAFVARYFSQAQKFIHVDRNDLKSSVRWITRHQLENGCFPVIGKFYHQDIKKKVLEEDSSKTLTAYILISLIESGMSPKSSTVVKNAIYCLKGTDEPAGLYGDLMTAYALILAEEKREGRTMMTDLLAEAKRSYRMLWWENEENSSVESNIEMTAYGILSLIKLGGSHFLSAASDAVRWVTQYRNQNGGFVSTQDTIVALEAIAKFSKILPKINDDDTLSISIRDATSLPVFNITRENRMLQQNLKLPSYSSNVTFDAEGKGCALVQTVMSYNTRRGTSSEKFKVNLKIDSVSEIDVQSIKKFHVCARYKGAKDKINMAVLEVFMVSGFYPDRSSLYDVPISHRGVRMWEEYENKVNFYFEDLRNKKICLQFLVRQEICVENSSPAMIKLYDYYDTQYQSTIRYNLQSKCNQSQTWLDSSDEIKNEAKRELKMEDFTEGFKRTTEEVVYGFQDVDFDLETPQGGNGIMPVFALPPPPGNKEPNCPLCLTTIPELFPKMYCSAQAAVKVFIRGKDIFDFRLDLTPRKNVTTLRRTVSFTMKKDCECPVLNSVNSYALLLVTPPRTVSVNVLQEMHLDSLTQLYSLEKGEELPKFVTDAIDYCKNWKFDER